MIRLRGYAWYCSSLLLLCACGGSSPTAPDSVGALEVETPHGMVSVRLSTECPTSTDTKIRNEISQGYGRAIREAPEAASVPVEPLSVHVLSQRQVAVWFTPPADRVEYGCGDEGALEHEMGHRIAHYLGRSCVAEVWHSVDLNCNPR